MNCMGVFTILGDFVSHMISLSWYIIFNKIKLKLVRAPLSFEVNTTVTPQTSMSETDWKLRAQEFDLVLNKHKSNKKRMCWGSKQASAVCTSACQRRARTGVLVPRWSHCCLIGTQLDPKFTKIRLSAPLCNKSQLLTKHFQSYLETAHRK